MKLLDKKALFCSVLTGKLITVPVISETTGISFFSLRSDECSCSQFHQNENENRQVKQHEEEQRDERDDNGDKIQKRGNKGG